MQTVTKMNLCIASSTNLRMPTFWIPREGRSIYKWKTEAFQTIFRGSRDGMYQKNYSAVPETQYGEGTRPATDEYKDIRNFIRPYWESEGFIVPFEAKGQHNPGFWSYCWVIISWLTGNLKYSPEETADYVHRLSRAAISEALVNLSA